MNISIGRSTYESLVNRFLVITAETDILDYIEDGHRKQLNGLLNDLNSLDYKILQIGDSKVQCRRTNAIYSSSSASYHFS